MSTPLPPARWYHVGPHAYYDLVRLARRGRTTLVRMLYILALFAALAAVDLNTTPLEAEGLGINHNARIAERFSKTILAAQNFAVLILMPIYCVASIQEERDKQTLALLFTTQLSAWGILLGKLLSRAAHVAGVVAAGLPILSFVQLWGGIDMPMIAANFWNTALLIVSVGALSLLVASRVHRLASALTLTYFALLAALLWMMCCCVPVASFNRSTLFLLTPSGALNTGYSELLTVAALLTIGHVSLTALCLITASIILRRLRDEPPAALDPFAMMGIDPAPEPEASNDPRHSDWPPITEPALVWKECHSNRHCLFALSLLMLPFVSVILIAVLLLSFQGWVHNGPERNAERFLVLKSIMLFTLAWYMLSVTWRLAGCVVRERQQRTLDGLLTLPIDRREILWCKVRGNLARSWHLLAPSGAALAGLLIFDYAEFLTTACVTLAVLVQAAFCASLGLYLSVVCRTAMSAYVTLSLCLMLLFFGVPIVPTMMPMNETAGRLMLALDPTIAWRAMLRDQLGDLAMLLGAAVYAAAAMALWKVAGRQFARNPSGT
jgi:ABC-type transport system involved in multi-copper enzyme maturation permease subunit